jgi:hypothetical protein
VLFILSLTTSIGLPYSSERFLAAKAAIDLLFDVNRRQVVDLESLGVKQ